MSQKRFKIETDKITNIPMVCDVTLILRKILV